MSKFHGQQRSLVHGKQRSKDLRGFKPLAKPKPMATKEKLSIEVPVHVPTGTHDYKYFYLFIFATFNIKLHLQQLNLIECYLNSVSFKERQLAKI